jgi:opacity protein-like surface antigen
MIRINTILAGAMLAAALAAPALVPAMAQSSDSSSSASSTPGGEGSFAIGSANLPVTGTAFNDGTRDAPR